MQGLLERAPEGFRRVIQDFVRESREELFPTAEACVEWAKAHFGELVSGELGGNLLSKYSMLGRFFVTTEALEFLKMGIAEAVGDRLNRQALDAVIGYLGSVLLPAPFSKSVEENPVWTTEFDVEAWRDSRYAQPIEAHAFERRRVFATRMDEEKKAQLLVRIRTFGEHPAGLGKFTRTMFARDLRRSIVPASQPALANA